MASCLCKRSALFKKAMWFETERVSVFPSLSLGPNPVLIVVCYLLQVTYTSRTTLLLCS